MTVQNTGTTGTAATTATLIMDRSDKTTDNLNPEKQTLDKQARKIAWEAQKRQKDFEEKSAGFSIKALRDQAVYPDSRKFFDLLTMFDRSGESLVPTLPLSHTGISSFYLHPLLFTLPP